MIDLKFTAGGDIMVDANGDISLTSLPNTIYETSEDDAIIAAQMAYMALKTELGDFLLYPNLGNELYKIIGLPNKESTAKIGNRLIKQALQKWNVPGSISVESYPIDLQKLRFEIKITVGSPSSTVTLTIDKILSDLGLES